MAEQRHRALSRLDAKNGVLGVAFPWMRKFQRDEDFQSRKHAKRRVPHRDFSAGV